MAINDYTRTQGLNLKFTIPKVSYIYLYIITQFRPGADAIKKFTPSLGIPIQGPML